WLLRTLQPQLATLTGVQRVTIEGGRQVAMRVWIDPDRLAALNLSPGDVHAALRRNNFLAAVGQTKGNPVQVNLLANTDLRSAYDATVFMEDALTEITKTLGETIMIVGLVVFLFMGSVRTALVPLVAMPVSLIGAGIVMLAFGFSLNLLTILALVLSVGLVVDDAIVVVENVERHVRRGESRLDAALIGARELLGPIIAMTITLAVVYAPIGFQGGLTGSLFLEFAFTLAAAVVVSGIVAVTLSPVMSSRFVHPHGEQGRLTALVHRGFELVRRAYAWLLDVALAMRGE